MNNKMSILEILKKRVKIVEKDFNKCLQKTYEDKDFIYHSEYGISLQYGYKLLKEVIYEVENIGDTSEVEYIKKSFNKLQKSLATSELCLYGSSDYSRYKYLCKRSAEQEILEIYKAYLEAQKVNEEADVN